MMTTPGSANGAGQITAKDPVYHVVTEDDLVMLFELGNLAREQGKLRQAEAIFRGILAVRGDVAGGYMGLSRVHMDQGRVEEALQLLQATAALEGKHRDLGQAFLGSMLLIAGRAREAVRILQPVVDSGRQNDGVALARSLLENEAKDALGGEPSKGIGSRNMGR